MVIKSNRAAYIRRHLCELLLLLLLAAPVLVVSFSGQTVAIVAFFLVALSLLGYRTDMASTLRVDEDGIAFLEGGRDVRFLAWPEIGEVVPRRFRGWPAEDALVALNHEGRPLLVAGVSMFGRDDVVAAVRLARQFVPVTPPVILSPFTARSKGRRRPELAPQRASERLLASSVGGMVMALIMAVVILVLTKN